MPFLDKELERTRRGWEPSGPLDMPLLANHTTSVFAVLGGLQYGHLSAVESRGDLTSRKRDCKSAQLGMLSSLTM
jgi:hypothetical protein